MEELDKLRRIMQPANSVCETKKEIANVQIRVAEVQNSLVLLNRQKLIQQLYDDLENVLQNMDLLNAKLRQSVDQEKLPVERRYAGDALKIFQNICFSLREYENHIDLFRLHKPKISDDEAFEKTLNIISANFKAIQKEFLKKNLM